MQPSLTRALSNADSGLRRLGRQCGKGAARLFLPNDLVVFHGSRSKKRIALTFDDGPDPMTPEYLRVLSDHGTVATFFVVGERCKRYPSLVREIAECGHELAVHGYSHRPFTGLHREEIEAELVETAALLPSEHPRKWVRPPYGKLSPSSLVACKWLGFTTVLWSLDSDDARTHDADALIRHFTRRGAAAGDIVLFHEGQRWTLQALPRILSHLMDSSHDLVTVSDMLAG